MPQGVGVQLPLSLPEVTTGKIVTHQANFMGMEVAHVVALVALVARI